jgi:hypothetical protein
VKYESFETGIQLYRYERCGLGFKGLLFLGYVEGDSCVRRIAVVFAVIARPDRIVAISL